jgi:hypothetical protein
VHVQQAGQARAGGHAVDNPMNGSLMQFVCRLVLAFLCAGLVAFSSSAAHAQDTKSQGPLSPATVADDASYGNVAWSRPGNAKAADNVYATNAASATTHYLKATNFGFTIPPGATILGIVVQFEIKDDGTEWQEDSVRIVKGGAIGSIGRSRSAAIPDSDEYRSRGSSTDLWGETWTSGNINATNFGFVIAVAGIGFGSVSVDHMRVTVHYSPSQGPPSSASAVGKSQGKGVPTTHTDESPLNPSKAPGLGKKSKEPKGESAAATPVRPVTRPDATERPASSTRAEPSGGSDSGLGRTLALVFALVSGVNFVVAIVFYGHSLRAGRAAARRERKASVREERRVSVRRPRPAFAGAAVDGAPTDQQARQAGTVRAELRTRTVEPERPSLAETLAASTARRREVELDEVERPKPAPEEGRRETCKIALWCRDSDCDFYAQVEGPEGEEYVAARSPMFRWHGDDSPPENVAILAAHNVLVQRLGWEGWKLEGGGRSWWEGSFWRTAKAPSLQTR